MKEDNKLDRHGDKVFDTPKRDMVSRIFVALIATVLVAVIGLFIFALVSR